LIRCVACGDDDLTQVLDLMEQPLANNLRQHTKPYPLALNLCRGCWHLQLSTAVDPALLFREYLYVSGTSKTLRDHFDWFARFVREEMTSAATVLEIACNDGSQLNSFADMGFATYGVDPAENLAPQSRERHEVVCDFFNANSVSRLSRDSFDVVVAQNVVAHTADPHQLLMDCASVMHDGSLLFIQTSQANMVLNNEFDTIYHEHISFFSLNSMRELVRRSGLHLIDAIKSPIHGVSWIFVIGKVDSQPERVMNLLALERASGLHDAATYQRYSDRCKDIQHQVKFMLNEMRDQGVRLVGYGAAAKGMTLLNSIGERLDMMVDDNPLKQGLLAPGNMTPIVGIDALAEISVDDPVMFVPLAWNFFDEIRGRIKSVRSVDRDLFLRYFPTVELR